MIISILAGGWSARGLNLKHLPGVVIGVNDSGVLAPKVNIVVTMDRLWLEYRWEELKQLKRTLWARPAALLNIKERPTWLTVFDCDWQTSEFTDEAFHLNGTNSGGCALNLAYQLRPSKVYLFGFDMCRGPKLEVYWHKPYPWKPMGGTSDTKYSEWSKQFDKPAQQFKEAGIEVINCSLVSRIKVWPKIDPNSVLVSENA